MTPMVFSEQQKTDAKPQWLAPDASFEAAFRQRYPLVWLLTLIGPWVLTAVLLVLLYLTQGKEYVGKLLGAAAAAFLFFGRFIILGGQRGEAGALQTFLSPEELFLMLLYMDLLVACVLIFHLGFVFRLPFLGPRLQLLVEDGHFILRSNPWMKRASFIGLVAFVMFPLAATGSIGGSIFGRLLGMSRLTTFLGVALGSLLGCGMMYFGNSLLLRHLNRDNPVVMYGGIVIIALIILLLNHRYRQLKARTLAEVKRRMAENIEPGERAGPA
ncbi:MAG: small multi-drug export protein [Gemmataceae bacterium]